MTAPSDPREELRNSIMGLGERSLQKSYYPELQRKLGELERFRALLDQTQEYILLVHSRTGLIMDANGSCCRGLGCDRDRLVGTSLEKLEAGSVITPLARMGRDFLSGAGGPVTRISALRRCGGGEVPVEVTVSLVAFTDDVYSVLVARDISERLQAEKEKLRLEDQLRQAQKMEAVGRLAGGVAHDFNNLLTALECYTGLLLASIPPGDERRADVEEIRGVTERAGALTRQLLAFSRKQMLAPRVLDLNALLANLAKMLSRLIGETYTIEMRTDPDLATIKADPGQLEQVVLNLVVNARDSMPAGGRILISTRNSYVGEEGAVPCCPLKPGDYVLLSVSDSGSGMDEATQAHIFEPFFTTKGEGRGTGLGLSTVYGIVTQSGGHIAVESAPGKGTTMKVYLPRCAAAGDEGPGAEAALESLRGSETVLVAEDEPSVRGVISRILRYHGYEVLEAADGLEAAGLLARRGSAISAAVLDLVLPKMGGAELAARLKSDFPGVKVLLMSGHADHPEMKAEALKGVPFLQKPVTAAGLLGELRRLLDGGQSLKSQPR